jgi:hypothetical protein
MAKVYNLFFDSTVPKNSHLDHIANSMFPLTQNRLASLGVEPTNIQTLGRVQTYESIHSFNNRIKYVAQGSYTRFIFLFATVHLFPYIMLCVRLCSARSP